MKTQVVAPRGASPAVAKIKRQSDSRKDKRNNPSAQVGLIELRDGKRVAARIVSAGRSALLFVGGSDGMRQVGGVLNVGGVE